MLAVIAAAAAAGGMCSDPSAWVNGSAYTSKSQNLTGQTSTPAECCALCAQAPGCLHWTHKLPSGNCFLFTAAPNVNRSPTQSCVRGDRPPAPTPAPPPTPPPSPAPKGALNVLMIAIDDMRPELTPYGAAHMHTPNMQRLADRSVLFSRAYVQVALCMPSRTALLTSRRPDTSMDWTISPTQWPRTCGGACGGDKCGAGCGIPGLVTLPQWFKEHGYYTIGMGKIFHEGKDTQLQDYRFSWTPSTTNPQTGVFEASGGPRPQYNGTAGHPSWYAFDVDDEAMTETMLAEHAVGALRNLSAGAIDEARGKPFFVAVGFHKPHVPWYAPKKYWDFYPSDTVDLAPNVYEPINVPRVAMQSILRGWATPHKTQLDCQYTDLCAEIPPGSAGMSKDFPFDNTTIPSSKARELRRAYWAALSYTDANIGRVLDALAASRAANETVVSLWGDHGYQLGDNDMWAKQTNFEHATRIPFMVLVPGVAPGVTDALVEEVDLFPTLVEAAGAAAVPACPAAQGASRATGLCTEGFSLMPLLRGGGGARWGRAAFSQYTRGHEDGEPATDSTMGYTVRVDRYRYTAWFPFNTTAAAPDLVGAVATELYAHGEAPLPVDWSVEHENIAGSADPATQRVVSDLHAILVKCAVQPYICGPADFAPYVTS